MRTIGTILGIATALALTAVASPGAAQEFGKKGDAVFSAERLFGFQSTHVHEDDAGPMGDDLDNDWTYFGIGWRGNYISDFSPYDVPRFGFDYLVIDGLSIGGSLGFATIDGDTDNGFFGLGDDPNGTSFLINPRVGYVYMFSKVIGIWPRGGIVFHSFSVEGDNDEKVSENGFGLNLECMFPIVPGEHWGFLVGPTFDIDFTGEREYEFPGPPADFDNDRTYRTIGLQAGIFGWL
jgi:hypothetical protein